MSTFKNCIQVKRRKNLNNKKIDRIYDPTISKFMLFKNYLFEYK